MTTAVIASEAKQSRMSPQTQSGLLRRFAPRNDGVKWHAVNREKRMKQPCVYIVASKRNGTLYTGVTANILRRTYEHREGLVSGFSSKYGCKILVWYELYERMVDAIA